MFRRIGFPVLPMSMICEGCSVAIDAHGFHRSTCMRTGRVHARHRILLMTWVRILREAGLTIRTTEEINKLSVSSGTHFSEMCVSLTTGGVWI